MADYCKHGNRIGSAAGGEHLCGACENGEPERDDYVDVEEDYYAEVQTVIAKLATEESDEGLRIRARFLKIENSDEMTIPVLRNHVAAAVVRDSYIGPVFEQEAPARELFLYSTATKDTYLVLGSTTPNGEPCLTFLWLKNTRTGELTAVLAADMRDANGIKPVWWRAVCSHGYGQRDSCPGCDRDAEQAWEQKNQGNALLSDLARAARRAGKISYGIYNKDSGAMYRVLGSAPAPNAAHMTVVWVRRDGQKDAMPWDPATLMSDDWGFVALCPHDYTLNDSCPGCDRDAEQAAVRTLLATPASGLLKAHNVRVIESTDRQLGRATQLIRELMELANDVGSRADDTLRRAGTFLAETDPRP